MTDVYALTHQILALWDFADPAASATRFAAAAAAAADDPVRHQVLLTQLARTHGLRDDVAGGDAILDALGSVPGMAAEPAARSLLERGRLRNTGGDPAAAVPLFNAAYEAAVMAGLTGLAADAAHMLAIVLPADQQEQWAQRGLELAVRSPDPLARTMVGTLLNNLGWTYADRGDWAGALRLFDRALQARQEQGDRFGIHVAHWARARALRGLGRHGEALALLRELGHTADGADDPYVAEEIAANERAVTGSTP